MFNPTRRSRKIGLTQGGRVTDGKPSEKWSRFFGHNIWHDLSESNLQSLIFIEENPSKDFYHPATIQDYRDLLEKLQPDLTEYLRAVILRRAPSRDVKLGVEARKRFSCIIINAFPVSNLMIWNSRPIQKDFSHYAPWCDNWINIGGKWALQWSTQQIRRYCIYHLFLHELGHINQPAYHSLRRREDFAENFALSLAKELGVLS